MTIEECTAYFSSPIGTVHVSGTSKGITGVAFIEEEKPETREVPSCLLDCVRELKEYFGGERRVFDSLQLELRSTDLEREVWDAVCCINFGKTASYKDIAKTVHRPRALRAVGQAVGRNVIAIIIPCHRILPSSGEVGEYRWGAWRKEWLLKHERWHSV